MQEPGKKILLGMLVANGDCLMATVLARQIKNDYPGCHITWAISNLCRQMIESNPDVDTIWEIPLQSKKAAEGEAWFEFVKEANERKARGEFDELFFTQVYPSNVHHYDGTTRGTIYNAYPHPVTVDARPVLRLSADEISRVKKFAEDNKLASYKHVILFESSSFSGQSFVTQEWALRVVEKLVSQNDDLFVIISSHEDLSNAPQRTVSARHLSLRENAELTKYCTLLVGCSSGITWITTSDWAKRLPMVQFLRRGIGFTFASVAYDHQYWELDNLQIIETVNDDTDHAVRIIGKLMNEGIAAARKEYHQQLKPRFISMLKYAFMFFRKGKLQKSAGVIRNFVIRNYIQKKRQQVQERAL